MVNFTSFLIKGVLPIAISMLMRGLNVGPRQILPVVVDRA